MGRFSSLSICWLDSSIARRIAFTVFGFFLGELFGESEDFFRMVLPHCCVVMAVKPMPSAMARAFHGSPTQKPSILPTFILATICGGGIVINVTSLSG